MRRKTQKDVTVGFVALGCPKNVVDSERMLAQIAQAGFLIAADPDRADVVVVNTCGFIEPARAESLEAIRQALANKKTGHVHKVIVAGCMSQHLGREIIEEVAGVDAILGLEQRDAIAEVIRETLTSDALVIRLSPPAATIADDRTRLRIGPAHSAYLRISEGCDHRCSFCTIPLIRGPFRSKPAEVVLSEARELASSGAVELNVIGQDTTRYGRDVKAEEGLAALLGQLEQIPEVAWIRLLYAYPAGVTDRLIEAIGQSEKIVHYLDLPMQHVSDVVLRAMRRPDTRDRLQKRIEKLRSAMSDIVLRTTLIVGFPGETDEDFAELIDFVKWARFEALGAFPFYPEVGTPAAEMSDQVPEELKQERLEELMLTQQEIAFAANRRRVGSRLTCLVDSLDSRGQGLARFYGQAPDIDSLCIVSGCSAAPGQFITAEVTGTQDYDLLLEQV